MTNREFSKAYLDQASALYIKKDADQAKEDAEWFVWLAKSQSPKGHL